MQAKWIRRAAGLIVLAIGVAATVYALQPAPLQVDLAAIGRGPLSVTVDEDGIARIKDVFQVSAPIAGMLERAPIHVGELVHRNTTAVAIIRPLDPPFLDVRSRRELEAIAGAAEAGVQLARAQLRSAEATERLAEGDMARANRLAKAGTISDRAFEKAATEVDVAQARIAQAIATLALRKSELVSAEARLIEPDQQMVIPDRDACCFTVRAPVDGVVLRVLAESERVVAAGTPLLEIGDPKYMEIIVDLLSSDGVAISEGASATLSQWGGEGLLSARVIRIDPAGYAKVSALGIEEQRVDAVLELLDDPKVWQGLGHEFRVMVHIVLWENPDVLLVPMGALFRRGTDWSVFRVVEGKVESAIIEIGQRNSSMAEIISGLSVGDRVILHPSDRVVEGVQVMQRDADAG